MIDRCDIRQKIIRKTFLRGKHKRRNQKCDGKTDRPHKMKRPECGRHILFPNEAHEEACGNKHLQNIAVDCVVLKHTDPKHLNVMDECNHLYQEDHGMQHRYNC